MKAPPQYASWPSPAALPPQQAPQILRARRAMDVVGLAASIATLLKAGYYVLERIQDFRDFKNPFTDIVLCLPLLLRKVEDIDKDIVQCNQVDASQVKALKLAIDGCKKNITRLEAIFSSLCPNHEKNQKRQSNDSLKAALRAIKSIRKEKEILKVQQILQSYESTFSFFFMDIKSNRNMLNSIGDDLLYEVPNVATDRFVGRKKELERIKVLFDTGSNTSRFDRTVVLVGLGGQGKTQLALEYCRLVRPTQSVIYLNALSPGTLRRSFERIALRLFGTPVEDSSDFGAAEVYRLLTKRAIPFLVIFDNLDGPQHFDSVWKYLPDTASGSVLITTRNYACSSFGNVLEIGSMEVNEAVDLLVGRAGFQPTDKEDEAHTSTQAIQIVEELGRLPLAIDLAASYMRARSLPLSMFLAHYARRRKNILGRSPDINNYIRQVDDVVKENGLSVFTTWELSFNQLGQDEEERSRYAHILTLAAFVDFTRVSQVFFEFNARTRAPNANEEDAWDPLDHQDMVVLFRNVSLVNNVQFTDGQISFSLHPLVASWLRDRLTPDEKQALVKEVTQTLVQFSEEWMYSGATWAFSTLNEMLGHIDRFFTNGATKDGTYDRKNALLSMADASVAVCRVYLRHTRFQEAEAFVKSYMGRGTGGGDSGFHSVIGELYLFHGDIEKADIELLTSLEQATKQYGVENQETLRCMSMLAFCRFTQSKFSNAESLYKTIYATRVDLLGRTNHDTLDSARMLGETYRLQEKYDESLPLLTAALDGLEYICGRNHFRTAMAISSLASLYRDRGDLLLAHKLLDEAWEIYNNVYGEDNSSTYGALLKLGFINEDQGLGIKAIDYYIAGMAIRIENAGFGDGKRAVMARLAKAKRLIKDFRFKSGLLARAIEHGEGIESEPELVYSLAIEKLKTERDSLSHVVV